MLFELIAERYEHKSLAITANTPFSQWGEVFVEPAMTLAAVDRLVHHSTILEMNRAANGLAPAATVVFTLRADGHGSLAPHRAGWS